MGCIASKDTTSKVEEQQTFSNIQKSDDKNGEVDNTRKSSFVEHSDFVGQKKGNITDYYQFDGDVLGKGGFGEVRRIIHKQSGIVRAVKIIYKQNTSKEEQEQLQNEVAILRKLDHPNIIKVYEFYEEPQRFFIVTDLCLGGELFDKIYELKQFTEKKAAQLMNQVFSVVNYCHKHNIVHRDLKPENILFSSKEHESPVKVIDFGTSRSFNRKQKMNQKFGTPYYIAPEVIKGQYTEKCDIWSLGVITYILLCGYPPFNGANDRVIMDKVLRGLFDFKGPEWRNVSAEAKNFILYLLEYDMEKRPSAEEALKHPWIQGNIQSEEVEENLSQQVFSNLKSFKAEQKLAHAIWLYLVDFMLTEQEKEKFSAVFRSFDKDNDGLLSKEEIREGFYKVNNRLDAEQEFEEIMKLVDKNQSGLVDYTEFIAATINRELILTNDKLEQAFKIFDHDGNGYLNAAELKAILGNNSKISESFWTDLVKEVDENGDGQISFEEFKVMMKALNKNQ